MVISRTLGWLLSLRISLVLVVTDGRRPLCLHENPEAWNSAGDAHLVENDYDAGVDGDEEADDDDDDDDHDDDDEDGSS